MRGHFSKTPRSGQERNSRLSNRNMRTRRDRQRAIHAFIVGVQFIASAVAIVLTDRTLRPLAIAAVGVLALTTLAMFIYDTRRARRRVAPPPPPPRPNPPELVVTPTVKADLKWIAQFERKKFGPIDSVPHKVLASWYRRNPHGFVAVKTVEGKPIGFVNSLPLKPASLQHFVNTRQRDRHISPDAIYRPRQKNSIKDLYLESFVCLYDNLRIRGLMIEEFLRSHDEMLQNLCDPKQIRHLYAIGARDPGIGLMRRLGFCVIQLSTRRPDGHDLYRIEYSVLLERLREFLPRRAPGPGNGA